MRWLGYLLHMSSFEIPQNLVFAGVGIGWRKAKGGQIMTWHQSVKSLTDGMICVVIGKLFDMNLCGNCNLCDWWRCMICLGISGSGSGAFLLHLSQNIEPNFYIIHWISWIYPFLLNRIHQYLVVFFTDVTTTILVSWSCWIHLTLLMWYANLL